MTLRSRTSFLITGLLVTLAAGCGGSRPQRPAVGATRPERPPPQVNLPRPPTPRGVVGVETAEYPTTIVYAAGSIWVFPHHDIVADRLDPRTNRVVAEINIGDTPCTTSAAGAGRVWTSNCGPGENSLGRTFGIDPVRQRVVLRVLGTFPAYGAGSLWVLDDSGKWVRRVDPQSGVVLVRIPTGSDQQPGGGALTIGGVGYDSVWLGSDVDRTVIRISTITDRVTAVIPLPGAMTQDQAFHGAADVGYIDGTQIAFADGKAWYGNPAGLFEIDSRSDRARLIRLPMRPFSLWGDIPVVSGAGSIWVRTSDQTIDRVDPVSGRVQGTYPADSAGGGGGILVVGHSLWVENAGEDDVWRERIRPIHTDPSP